MKTGVNPPRTPVTKGSMGTSLAPVDPCKMPGPPAPFIVVPFPNIAMSNNSLAGGTTKVKIEGQPVVVKGATFKSTGNEASTGTGGGVVSATTQGQAKFVSPGSLDTKAEGKAIHLLGDATTNNNGGAPNAMCPALMQAPTMPSIDVPTMQEAVDAAASGPDVDEAVKPEDPAALIIVLAVLSSGSIAGELKNAENGKIKIGVPYSPSGEPQSPRPAQGARRQAAQQHAAATNAGTASSSTYQESFVAAGGMPQVVAGAVVTGDPQAPPTPDNVEAVHDTQYQGGSGTTSPAQRQRTQDAVGASPSTVQSAPVGAK